MRSSTGSPQRSPDSTTKATPSRSAYCARTSKRRPPTGPQPPTITIAFDSDRTLSCLGASAAGDGDQDCDKVPDRRPDVHASGDLCSNEGDETAVQDLQHMATWDSASKDLACGSAPSAPGSLGGLHPAAPEDEGSRSAPARGARTEQVASRRPHEPRRGSPTQRGESGSNPPEASTLDVEDQHAFTGRTVLALLLGQTTQVGAGLEWLVHRRLNGTNVGTVYGLQTAVLLVEGRGARDDVACAERGCNRKSGGSGKS